MRLSAPLLVISAALAAVWAQASLPPAQDPYNHPDLAPAAASDGLSARLSELGAPPAGPVAAAEGQDGVWRLRGRTPLREGALAGWPAPLYAEARRTCDEGLGRPGCWTVTLLEIDGAAAALPAEGGR